MAEPMTGDLPYQSGKGWIQIQVRVQPRSSSEGIAGILGGVLKVRLRAPPVEGKANRALQDFLSHCLGIPNRDVEIVSGERSRSKRVRLHGVSPEALAQLAAGIRHG
jgi:hypothetical protein